MSNTSYVAVEARLLDEASTTALAETFRVLGDPTRVRILDALARLGVRPEHVALLEERIEDIRGVMSAARSEHATIFGVSEGGAMACLFAATFPDLTRGLILWGTKARWLRAPDYPWGVTRETARSISDPAAMVARSWPPEWFLEANAAKISQQHNGLLFTKAEIDVFTAIAKEANSPFDAASLKQVEIA